jgi:NAD(P)-dependent dehydrogenase (short-subunit alcohol dehydrogenase family)
MNILITGCSRGLGRGFLESYLKLPDVKRVWAVTTSADKLKDLQSKFADKLRIVSASVSEESARHLIHASLGNETLDLLINCAGAYSREPDEFTEIRVAALKEDFNVNACSVFLTSQACLTALRKSKNAKLVSLSSLMGSIQDNTSGGSYSYRMSKAALNMFNRSFSIDFPEITSVVLHPGWVKTEMGGEHAPTSIEESVAGMIKVISGLKPEHTGNFYDHDGDLVQEFEKCVGEERE